MSPLYHKIQYYFTTRSVFLFKRNHSKSIIEKNFFTFQVRHNIAYGNLSAGESKVIEAAKMAEIHESILQWPKVVKK